MVIGREYFTRENYCSASNQPGFHTPTPNIHNIIQQPFLCHATKCAGFQSTVIFGILFFDNLKIKLVSLGLLIEIVNTYCIVFLSQSFCIHRTSHPKRGRLTYFINEPRISGSIVANPSWIGHR